MQAADRIIMHVDMVSDKCASFFKRKEVAIQLKKTFDDDPFLLSPVFLVRTVSLYR